MIDSAMARLMAQAAAIMRSVRTTPAPKAASPNPTVNTWVPAPRASAYARVIQARWRAMLRLRMATTPRTRLTPSPELTSSRVAQRMSPVPAFWG
jgi:hypothetical protein